MQFLVQIALLDVRGRQFEHCEDSLTVNGLDFRHGPSHPVIMLNIIIIFKC